MRATFFAAAGAAAALLLSAGSTLAADATPASTAPAAPTARQVELSRQLIEASGMRANYASMMHTMMGQMLGGDSKVAADPKMAALRESMTDAMDKTAPKFIDMSADVYARTYTERELEDILAFYKTPAGKALLAKTPLLMQNLSASMMKLMPGVMQETFDGYCRKMTCTQEEKQHFDAAVQQFAATH